MPRAEKCYKSDVTNDKLPTGESGWGRLRSADSLNLQFEGDFPIIKVSKLLAQSFRTKMIVSALFIREFNLPLIANYFCKETIIELHFK